MYEKKRERKKDQGRQEDRAREKTGEKVKGGKIASNKECNAKDGYMHKLKKAKRG